MTADGMTVSRGSTGLAVRVFAGCLLWALGSACGQGESNDALRCDSNADCAAGDVCDASYCRRPPNHPADGINGIDVSVPPADSDETPIDSGTSEDPDSSEDDPTDPPTDPTAPQVAILSPTSGALVTGVVAISAEVTTSSTIPADAVRAVVDSVHHVTMTRAIGNTYSGAFDTALLGDGILSLDLVVLATDSDGKVGRAASRFTVDHSLAVGIWVSAAEIVAGGVVQVGCEPTRGGQAATDLSAAAQVYPNPGPIGDAGGGLVDFAPKQAGKYEVRCVLEGGGVRSDPRTLQVFPGAVVAVATLLEEDAFVAGQSTQVSCAPVDEYGNAVYDSVETVLVVPEVLEVLADADAGLAVTSTVAGSYEITCRRGALTDTASPSVTVLPDVPVATEATVSADVVRPTEVIEVSCSMVDTYGNAVVSIVPQVVMAAPRGLPPDEAGVVVDGGSASATRVGFYHIYCLAPGHVITSQVGVYVEVIPGFPARWDVSFPPVGCSAYNRRLPFDFQVSDAWDNEVPDAQLDIRTTPANAVEERVGAYFLVAPEGPLEVEIDVARPHHVDSTIKPVSQTIMIDSKPPHIELETIELGEVSVDGQRGTMLQGGDMDVTDVHLSVHVADELSSITDVRFNDEVIAVDGTSLTERFDAVQASEWGMSTITAIAKDACGNAGYLGQSYLRSPTYLQPGTASDGTAIISNAVVARLGQRVIDDSERDDLDDVCSIGEAMVRNYDWNGAVAVGQSLASKKSECRDNANVFGYGITRRDGTLVLENVKIDAVQPIDRGFYFDVSIGKISVPVHVDACFPACILGKKVGCIPPKINENLTVGATAVRAWGELGIRVEGSNPRVDLSGIHLSTGGFIFEINCGSMQSQCNQMISSTVGENGSLRRVVEGMVEDAVKTTMPPVVEDYIRSFELESRFAVEDPVQVDLDVLASLGELIASGPKGSGHLDVGLNAQVSPPRRGLPDSSASLGAIFFGAAPISYDFTGEQSFGVGVRVDLLNQVLWSVWHGGAMDVPNLTDLVGDSSAYEGITASLFSHLPPVISQTADLDGVRVAIGDALIKATVDLDKVVDLLESPPVEQMQMEIYASFVVGAGFGIDQKNERLFFTFDPEPQINLHVAVIEYAEYEAQLSVLFTELLKEVMPQILNEAVISFEIPRLDLTDMVGEQAELRLSEGTVDQTDGYIRLQGGVEEVR